LPLLESPIMTKPLTFSVGIPAYNQGEFLEETILSLLNQTCPPDEIVISDHHSTDNTPEIIEKYSRHVRGLKPPPGCNISDQWNFTLSSLSGEWCTLLSSDDIARPHYCEVLIRGAQRREDAVVVRAGWDVIDRDGKVLASRYLLSVNAVTLPPATLMEQRYGPKTSFAAFAINRHVLTKSGGYPPNMESFGDWPMFMQLAPFGSFIYESELISGYRVGHGDNKFRNRFGMWVRDEQRMFYDVMPLAAQRVGMKDTTWIDKASRTNFLRYIAAAYDEFAPMERAALFSILEPWAKRVDGLTILESFLADRPLPASFSNVIERGKQIVRPFAQKIHVALRNAAAE
jgi:glycosyltransferase involved in cell wall biosynthesis